MRIMDVNDGTVFTPDDFSNSNYTCVNCINLKDRTPVLMMMSRTSEPSHWLVVDGFKQMVYTNYADAINYCKRMGYIKRKP